MVWCQGGSHYGTRKKYWKIIADRQSVCICSTTVFFAEFAWRHYCYSVILAPTVCLTSEDEIVSVWGRDCLSGDDNVCLGTRVSTGDENVCLGTRVSAGNKSIYRVIRVTTRRCRLSIYNFAIALCCCCITASILSPHIKHQLWWHREVPGSQLACAIWFLRHGN